MVNLMVALFLVNYFHFVASNPLLDCLAFLPPNIRLGLGQTRALEEECKKQTVGSFEWKADAREGYQIATSIFQSMAATNNDVSIWFPALNDISVVDGITKIINDNSGKLNNINARSLSWPSSPANGIALKMNCDDLSTTMMSRRSRPDIDAAIEATEHWVEETLCRLKLCPFTASMTRAAVGLEMAQVKEGPIVIRHSDDLFTESNCPSASLAALFWEGVSEIANQPETEVSTSLLLAPFSFDDDFLGFASVCDDLIEPCVQITGADSIVGRAWFHPKYNAESVGHSFIIAGHALPASVVESFVEKFDKEKKPDSKSIARANDAVRWTPHATINLLRRSQLTAAKEVEASLPNKKPNSIYSRNVIRILETGILNDNISK